MVSSHFADELVSQNPSTRVSPLSLTESAHSVLADVDPRFDDYFDLAFFDADSKAVASITLEPRGITTPEPSVPLRYPYPQDIPTAHSEKTESSKQHAKQLPDKKHFVFRPKSEADESSDDIARVESQNSSTDFQDNQLTSPSNILPEPLTVSAVASPRRPRKTSATHSCQLCGKRFSNMKKLGFHASQDHGTAIFQCASCDSVFTRHDNRDKHQKSCQEKGVVDATSTKRALPPSEKKKDVHSSPVKRRRVNILGTNIATPSSASVNSISAPHQPASSFESDAPPQLGCLPSSQETTAPNNLAENNHISPTSEILPANYSTSFIMKFMGEVVAKMKALEEEMRELKKQANPNGEAGTTHSERVRAELMADKELIPPAMNQITHDAVKSLAKAFINFSRGMREDMS